VYKISFAVEQI